MSEPAKKISPAPEDHKPGEKPAILRMAESAAAQPTISYAVVHENGGSYIDGAPLLRWGEWRDNTYCGAIAAVTEILGKPVSYETLMGVSGICYRFAMKPDWDPSSVIPQMGTVWDDPIFALIGRKSYSLANDRKRDQRVKANLDAGIPVLGVGLTDAPEWHMLTGYSANAFFGRSYFDEQNVNPESLYYKPERNNFRTGNMYREAVLYPGEYPKGLLRFFDKPCKKGDPLALLKRSLEICLAYAAHAPFGGAVFGEAAYRVLIEGLEKDDADWEERHNTKTYHIGCLVDARRCAYVYLWDASTLLSGAKRGRLQDIAATYKAIVDGILAVVPYEKLSEAFALGNPGEPWGTELRWELAKVLRGAMEAEMRLQGDVRRLLEGWKE